jgi:hypothetical protein
MPDVLQTIINVLSQILRVIGLGVLGAGMGWLSLELIRKEAWQVHIAVYLGLTGLVIALSYVGAASLGAFAIGVAVAMFLWGVRKKKEAVEEK